SSPAWAGSLAAAPSGPAAALGLRRFRPPREPRRRRRRGVRAPPAAARPLPDVCFVDAVGFPAPSAGAELAWSSSEAGRASVGVLSDMGSFFSHDARALRHARARVVFERLQPRAAALDPLLRSQHPPIDEV